MKNYIHFDDTRPYSWRTYDTTNSNFLLLKNHFIEDIRGRFLIAIQQSEALTVYIKHKISKSCNRSKEGRVLEQF